MDADWKLQKLMNNLSLSQTTKKKPKTAKQSSDQLLPGQLADEEDTGQPDEQRDEADDADTGLEYEAIDVIQQINAGNLRSSNMATLTVDNLDRLSVLSNGSKSKLCSECSSKLEQALSDRGSLASLNLADLGEGKLKFFADGVEVDIDPTTPAPQHAGKQGQGRTTLEDSEPEMESQEVVEEKPKKKSKKRKPLPTFASLSITIPKSNKQPKKKKPGTQAKSDELLQLQNLDEEEKAEGSSMSIKEQKTQTLEEKEADSTEELGSSEKEPANTLAMYTIDEISSGEEEEEEDPQKIKPSVTILQPRKNMAQKHNKKFTRLSQMYLGKPAKKSAQKKKASKHGSLEVMNLE